MNFGIRRDYSAREHPVYFQDTQPDGKVWQPDVLPIAAYLARLNRVKTIVDVGCGRGQKLIPYADEFAIAGIDYGDNIHHCLNNYPRGLWVNADLEIGAPDLPNTIIKSSAVVCSDVVEHLRNPHLLALGLAQYAVCASFVVISTPDRERVYGYDHHGPPGNPHHVREWRLDELGKWFTEYPFNIQWAGWTRNNNRDQEFSTALLILTARGRALELGGLERAFMLEPWNHV